MISAFVVTEERDSISTSPALADNVVEDDVAELAVVRRSAFGLIPR